MRWRFIFLLIFISLIEASIGGFLYAQKQGQGLIDSLLQELPKMKEDTNKVNLLVSVSYSYYNSNPDEGIKYGEQALKLATQLKWEKGIANANNRIGVNYYRESDYLKALEYYEKALKIYEATADKHGAALITSNIGLVYQSQSDYDKALDYDFKDLKMAEEIGDKRVAGIITGNIANIYKAQKKYAEALAYDLKALKIKEAAGDKSSIAICLGNIGLIYSAQKDFAPAIAYEEQALQMAEETGNKFVQAENLLSIAACLVSITTDTSASVLKKEYNQDNIIPKSKAARLRKAIVYLQSSIAICKEIHVLDIMQQGYEQLAEAYQLSGDYKKALVASDSSRVVMDSVFLKENNQNTVRIVMQEETKRMLMTDSLKNMEKEKISAMKLRHQRHYIYFGIVGVLLLLGFISLILWNNKLLAIEKKRSDNLLLNILPAEIAEELKEKGTTTAKYFDNVTVLFTDFVNFTSAGERMSPQELIDELHTCFKKFDEITGKNNIEKIKTIGDAYLAVGGLPAADPKHAENIVSAALEINAFMTDRLAKMGSRTFEIRIGIHSGSVVAGIVGVKKFAYDIWGDTVNTAARMEQNSMPGRINISQTTYELVKDKFTCAYRGEVEAKNKGMLKMYYVDSAIHQSAHADELVS